MKCILVTGGAGFIGGSFLKTLRADHPDSEIIVIDKLTYASNKERIQNTCDQIYPIDIADKDKVRHVFEHHKIDTIIHFAAESHVDNSINSADVFINTNILGTYILLDMALQYWTINDTIEGKKFLHVSTDEVYGSLAFNDPSCTEKSNLSPNSPYSSSKASSDLLVLSYGVTHKMPVMVTRCCNNYGAYQHEEKMIPKMVMNALSDKDLPVYGDGKNVREWLHTSDHVSALMTVLEHGTFGEVYNIGSGVEKSNIEIVELILDTLYKPKSLIKFVEDRKGHDLRYSVDCSKIRSLGWEPKVNFEYMLTKTIEWYRSNNA
jgi:dTDP-glucose 4,6-dehydratase